MKKPTPISDEIKTNFIDVMLYALKKYHFVLQREASKEIKENNNNYFVFKENLNIANSVLDTLDKKNIVCLISKEQQTEIDYFKKSINNLIIYMNEKVNVFNNEQRKKYNVFQRSKLKNIHKIKYCEKSR